MRKDYQFWVYILTNLHNDVLYIGMTNNLARRMYEHINGLVDGFTKQYNVHKLVHYEEFQYVNNAIKREKQLKKFSRAAKMALVEESNPEWNDLGKALGFAT
jgi:putative endonuclease